MQLGGCFLTFYKTVAVTVFVLSVQFPKSVSQQNSVSAVCKLCSCSLHNSTSYTVDCSGKGLDKVPTFLPTKATTLLLNQNKITEISNNTFDYLEELEILDIGLNSIKQLEGNSFRGLNKLKQLSLKANKLSGHLPEGIFVPTPHLTFLDISGNKIDVHTIDSSLKSLTELEHLKMQADTYMVLGEGFSYLRNLKILDLSNHENWFEVHVYAIYNTTFKMLQNSTVEKLSLRNTHLKTIEKGSFLHLTHLKILDVSCNPELGLNNIKPLLLDLQHTRIEGLILDYVNENNVFNLLNIPFWCGTYKHLKYFSMEFNRIITDITPESYRKHCHSLPPKLEYISLAWNGIDTLVPPNIGTAIVHMFQVHKHIRLVNADFQKTNIVGSDIRWLAEGICNKPSAIFTHSKPPELSRERSAIDTNQVLPDQPSQENQCASFSFPPSLEYVYADGSYISIKPSKAPKFECNVVHSNLRVLSLTNTRIPTINRYYKGLDRLEILNLTSSNIKYIHPYFFLYMSNLKTLFLRNNDLTSIPNIGKLFNLETLDLSFNKIQNIPTLAFGSLHNVKQIKLNHNRLNTLLGVDFKNMTKLGYLDLAKNHLLFLERESLQQLEEISRHHELVLNLEGNTFACDCKYEEEVTTFIKWIRATIVTLVNNNTYSCDLKGNTTRLLDVDVDNFLNSCKTDSKNVIHVYERFLAVTAAFIVLLCICMAVGYKFRWSVRYKWFILKRKVKGHKNNQPEEVNNHQIRDAYVSYCAYDTGEGIKMSKTLEEIHGYTAYFEDRDFIVGDCIADNIISAIEQTKHTIIILTDAFLHGQWCDFVFQMTLVMRGTRPIMVVLADKPITVAGYEKMSKTLRQFIRRGKYIEWSEHEHDQGGFWTVMQEYLNHPAQDGRAYVI